MSKLTRWLDGAFGWLWSLRVPALAADETLIMDSMAVSNRGVLAPRGRLLLTSRRLIFVPSRSVFWPRRWWPAPLDLELSAIAAAEPGPLSALITGGLPGLPQFTVSLKDGKELKFQTLHATAWREAIAARISPASV